MMKIKHERTTPYMKHLAVSSLLNVSAHIKSTCNLTGKYFGMPNVWYTWSLTALITYILIAIFSTQGLYFVILVNAILLGGISFGLIYVRNRLLTKVYNLKDTMKWVITFIIVVPVSIYLNQLNWHVLMDIPRVNLALNLSINLVLSSILILVFVLLFKIQVRKYLYQMLPISLNKIWNVFYYLFMCHLGHFLITCSMSGSCTFPSIG